MFRHEFQARSRIAFDLVDVQVALDLVVVDAFELGVLDDRLRVIAILGEDTGDFLDDLFSMPPRALHPEEAVGAELRGLVGALRSRLRDGAVGGNRLAPYPESVHE